MHPFFEKVEAELARANEKHPPMNGIVEGLKTMQCEVAEFDREVHRNPVDMVALELELIQVAAMCLKFYKAFLLPQAIPETWEVCGDCGGEGFVTILGEKCDCHECGGSGKVIDHTANELEDLVIPVGMLMVQMTEINEWGPLAELLVKPFAANAFELVDEPGSSRKLIEKKHCKPINDPWELFDK